MKNTRSRKGFTLIEMLVVIAIIAVLVAIIIPTVTSATDKAEAAQIAANLRSLKAEITTGVLTNSGVWATISLDTENVVSIDDDMKDAIKGLDADKVAIEVKADKVLEVTYDGKTIAEWAAKAEGSAPAAT